MRRRLPRVFHREANLQRHLEVADLAVFDVSAGPRDFEPSQVSDGLVGALERGFHRLIDALPRRAHDLDDAIDVAFGAMLHALGIFRLDRKIDRTIAPSAFTRLHRRISLWPHGRVASWTTRGRNNRC